MGFKTVKEHAWTNWIQVIIVSTTTKHKLFSDINVYTEVDFESCGS